MMKYKNKFLSLLCLSLMLFVVVGFVGCKKPAPDSDGDVMIPSQEKQLEFAINNKEIFLYSTCQLYVNQTEGVTFESSNDSVATVDNSGLVYANDFGEAIITAKVGELQAQCSITVVGQEIRPSIQVGQEDIVLVWSKNKQIGSSFDIAPQVGFNGVLFTDGEFTFTTNDPSVVTVDSYGKVTANGYGNAVVSIQGLWRNRFDSSTLNKNINVTVKPDASIELIPETTLISTVNKVIDGKNYNNQTSISAQVIVDGEDYDTQISYMVLDDDITGSSTVIGDDNSLYWDGNGIVSIDGNTVTAKKAGTASIVAQCVVDGIEITSMPMIIEVVAPIIQANDDIYNVKDNPKYTFYGIEGDFISLLINGREYTEYVDANTVSLNLSDCYQNFLGDSFIEVLTTKYNYHYRIKFVTRIITDGDGFKECITENASNAYVILANDISFSVGNFVASSKTSFRGVFDGQGYTIDAEGTKISSMYGLFGNLRGELRDFALINVTVFGKESTILGIQSYQGSLVKNLYIQAKYEENTQQDYAELDEKNTLYYCGLFNRGFVFKNLILNIEYPESVTDGFALCAYSNVILVDNVYCYGNVSQLAATNSSLCYKNLSGLLLNNSSALTYKNGFAEFWGFNDNFIKFGDLLIADTLVKNRLTSSTSITLDLEELVGENITKAFIDGKPIEIPSRDELVLECYQFSSNVEHILKIYTTTSIIEQPFIFELNEERKAEILYKKDGFELNCADYDDATIALLNGKVFYANAGKIVIDLTTLIVGTEYDICLYADNAVIKQPIVKVTHIISNKEEFKAYLPKDSTRRGATKDTYAILIADIDFEGEAFATQRVHAYGYSGHFNGLGHTIKNVTVDYGGGIFGNFITHGEATMITKPTIENTVFINIVYTASDVDGGLICGQTAVGSVYMKNLYIEGKMQTSGSSNGIRAYSNHRNLAITNSIINIIYTNPARPSYVLGKQENKQAIDTVLAISNATLLDGSHTDVPYSTGAALLEAKAADVATWGGFWAVIDGEIYFNNTKVIAKSVG